MPIDREPVADRRRQDRPDAVGGGQLLLVGGFDGLQRAELGGQRARRRRSDVPDGQGDEDPPQWYLLGLVQVLQEPLAVGREHAVLGEEQIGLRQVFRAQRKQIALVADDTGSQQRRRRFIAERLNVEGTAAGQVEQSLAQLRRAGLRVGAADVDVGVLLRAQRRSALRAVGGHDEGALSAVAQVDDRA